MNIATLILAAGASSRMEQPKQLLAYRHTTLLGHTIQNALQSQVDNVYVVLGANAKLLQNEVDKFPVKMILNSNFKDGLSSSIVTGVEQLQDYDAVLIVLADQPKIDASYLNQLISEFKDHPNQVIASRYENSNGVPALFPRSTYSKLLKLKGDKGAKHLLNSEDIPIFTMNSYANLLDIDTPEDYKKLTENEPKINKEE